MGNATSIFNLMRNIGASVGISMVETMQVRKAQMHVNILGKHVNPANPLARQTIDGLRALFMSQGKDSATATRQAYGAVWGMVQQQAAMLSFVEAFWVMGLIFLGMLPLLFLLRNARSLHPHTRKTAAPVGQRKSIVARVEPEEELVGVGH